MIIDVHAHYLPQLLYPRFDAEAAKFPSVQLLRGDTAMRLRFPGGDLEPCKVVYAAGFGAAERASILGGNAQGVFRIRRDCWRQG